MKIFKKIIIANRGEIAVRIMKTAKKLGIKTVAIYTDIEKDALHVKMADEAYCLGAANLTESYLNIDKIINIAKLTNSDALHPGYGFLSENTKLAKACEDNNIVFIGPNSTAIKLMGNKIEARKFVKNLNIPLTEGIIGTKEELLEIGKKDIFPLLVKAAAGGGGKGMRIVRTINELEEAIETTSREAQNYFGDSSVYVEKYIENPRHIEIQVIGDNFGNVVHLYERECSIQRRYQKIIEESPSPTLNQEVRERMGADAVKICKQINYNNAGTIEFLVDKDLNYYFLEMNTRIQVEHPVTEMVTRIDIVQEQIFIAAGNTLSFKQEDVSQIGHAIESRIYAEDPSNNFSPSPGDINLYLEPSGQNVRIDSGINSATTINSQFDPMISKFIVWDENRNLAIENSLKYLKNFVVHGIKNNIEYLIELLQDESYLANQISTSYCDKNTSILNKNIIDKKENTDKNILASAYLLFDFNKTNQKANVWQTIGYWRDAINIPFSIDNKEFSLKIDEILKNGFIFNQNNEKFETKILNFKENKIEFQINENKYVAYVSEISKNEIYLTYNGFTFKIKRKDVLNENSEFYESEIDKSSDSDLIVSPIHGKVIKINFAEGDEVKKGSTILVIEAMKMENNIQVLKDATIEKINVKVGAMVASGKKLVNLK